MSDREHRLANMRAVEAGLDAEIAELMTRVNALRKEKHELRTAALPVAVGDIVIATRPRAGGTKGEEMIVREVEMKGYDPLGAKPWVKASRRKANGEWSGSAIHLFNDWHLKEN